MKTSLPEKSAVIQYFTDVPADFPLPEKFTFPFHYQPHPIALLAVEKLQAHLEVQQNWTHNFGLAESDEMVIGKMFGVLVVRTEENRTGYLAAFSGKLASSNHHEGFVPPIFDGLADGGFLNAGMTELSDINVQIKALETGEGSIEKVMSLKEKRKIHSCRLQNEIYNQYHFLNQTGEEKSLRAIFDEALYKNPPAGAGECAAPKLLQYAFKHNMKPIAMAEFWWGQSPKSSFWKHRQFYPACREKCEPILAHMLAGMELDDAPIE